MASETELTNYEEELKGFKLKKVSAECGNYGVIGTEVRE